MAPYESLHLWRRRDSVNSAPMARVRLCMPDGARLQRHLRINYNMSELRNLLAAEMTADPEQLDIYTGTGPEQERIPDFLVLAGLDVESREVTLHVRLRKTSDAGRTRPLETGGTCPGEIPESTGTCGEIPEIHISCGEDLESHSPCGESLESHSSCGEDLESHSSCGEALESNSPCGEVLVETGSKKGEGQFARGIRESWWMRGGDMRGER